MNMRRARAMRLPAAACAGLLLALAACAAAAAGTKFRNGAWTLTCDNTGRCAAEGYPEDEGGNVVSVLLSRDAGPHARVAATVKFGSVNREAPFPSGPVRLAFSGRAAGTVVDGGPLAEAQVAALLKALAGTTEITFIRGKDTWALSGTGATSVLLKMDDVQGRVGTPGALIRKGAKPESSVPGPVKPPVVQAVRVAQSRDDDAPLARAILASRGSDDCPEADEPGRAADDGDDGVPTLWRLGGGRVLVSRWCFRGRYNEGSGFWLARDQPPYDPKLVTKLATEFVPDEGRLVSWMKGRGIGDCYGGSSWTWDGRDFVLTSESTTGECREVDSGGAWDLPTLVSEVRKPR
jgi:Protein of unknown function (DUF1176)